MEIDWLQLVLAHLREPLWNTWKIYGNELTVLANLNSGRSLLTKDASLCRIYPAAPFLQYIGCRVVDIVFPTGTVAYSRLLGFSCIVFSSPFGNEMSESVTIYLDLLALVLVPVFSACHQTTWWHVIVPPKEMIPV
jgi:hypothetical protein